jgi:DNA-binding beta-propeller fold protein YncE
LNAVFKENWTGSGTQTTIATGFNYPVGVAVDGAGNVYVADQNNTKVTEWSPSGSSYTFSGAYTGLGNVESVAVDGSGNLYVGSLAYGLVLFPAGSTVPYYLTRTFYPFGLAVDSQGVIYAADNSNNRIVTETLANGAFTQSTIASNLNGPHGLAVDGNGNVYVADTFDNQIVKLTRSGSSYSQSTLLSGINDPLGVALDATGNIYVSSAAAGTILKLDTADPPSLSFGTTIAGTTSTAQSVTVTNYGNAPLTFPLPAAVNNPNISANFALNATGSAACPQVSATSATPGTLAPNSSCHAEDYVGSAGGDFVRDNAERNPTRRHLAGRWYLRL